MIYIVSLVDRNRVNIIRLVVRIVGPRSF